MMKKLVFLLTLALLAGSAHAQLLWKVSGNGLQKDSYILGTMHIVSVSVADMISGMDDAIANCDIVIGEQSYESFISDHDVSWAQAPEDSTLDKLYTPDEYRIIQETLNKCAGKKLDLTKLPKIKPFALIPEIQKMIAIRNYPDIQITDFIDSGIMKRVVETGRPSIGLETSGFQTNLLLEKISEEPLTMQAMVLLELCRNEKSLDEMKQKIFTSIGAYVAQRLDYFESQYTDDEKLVTARNLEWIPKLEAVMPEKSCLICVGTAHLIGEKGLLQLFRDHGYTVEPMK